MVATLREICSGAGDDGLLFDSRAMRGEEIRNKDDYGGVRVRMQAHLGGVRIPVQVDVGFGDAVIPAPEAVAIPTLLDLAAPRILAYPQQAVVAEKLEAMVSLGVTNSRMKDFFDLRALGASGAFDLETLLASLRATFDRRRTPLPRGEPLVLTEGFLSEPERAVQWRAFLRRSRLDAPVDAVVLTAELRRFLLPVFRAAVAPGFEPMHWRAGGPWQVVAGDSSGPE